MTRYSSQKLTSWDHPREYGENIVTGESCGRCVGPSPRIRGELFYVVQIVRNKGTIPANTGRIPPIWTPRLLVRDHPREYGENSSLATSTSPLPGPSPRIRGECLRHIKLSRRHRTIPANTGRIPHAASPTTPSRDHPREYGENAISALTWAMPVGPSPRIRGEYRRAKQSMRLMGTIPANTGRMH